jgi:hypothetical protein
MKTFIGSSPLDLSSAIPAIRDQAAASRQQMMLSGPIAGTLTLRQLFFIFHSFRLSRLPLSFSLVHGRLVIVYGFLFQVTVHEGLWALV